MHEERDHVPVVLTEHELGLIESVLRRHPAVTGAILFGSRATGTAHAASDVDLALEGVQTPLQAETLASELDELPLPYRFDVQAFAAIKHESLLEHIKRAGVRIYG